MEGLPKRQEEMQNEPQTNDHTVIETDFPNKMRREQTTTHAITGDKVRTFFGTDGKPSREGHYNAKGELEYWLEYTDNAIDPIEHRVDATTTIEDLTKEWGEVLEALEAEEKAA